ncbi:orexin receptor type 2 [Plakobranchus ocellatus]|uniref:Orexin receptor type 2 n=1 Tax=Plakobranchus ocellatus TaxID=259542 RepID=A0AAV3ZMT9_9GAST|nr:orexin receptor type 2 [Plakobranchus ocellatus]
MSIAQAITSTVSTIIQKVVVPYGDTSGDNANTNNYNSKANGNQNYNSSDGSGVDLLAGMANGEISTAPGITTQGSTTVAASDEGDDYILESHVIAVSVILTCFSIFGILGNGLVLYVFSRKSDKVTSTIFILALAWTDFFTCLVIMPFTVTSLQLKNHLYYMGFCKLYSLLITSGVPLSVFIMVAIAVDRFFSICHPFLHIVTPRRAKISILCLLIFALCLGLITSFMYSTYITVVKNETDFSCLNQTLGQLSSGSPTSQTTFATLLMSLSPTTTQSLHPFVYNESVVEVNVASTRSSHYETKTAELGTDDNCIRQIQVTEYANGMCVETERIFTFWFMDVYQKIFISFYILSLLSVFMLYFFIYRSVVRRRAWRRKQKSWSRAAMTQMASTNPVGENEGGKANEGAALNNRGSVRSTLNNGDSAYGKGDQSLRPSYGTAGGVHLSCSAPNISGSFNTNVTSSTTDGGNDDDAQNEEGHEMMELTAKVPSQSQNNGDQKASDDKLYHDKSDVVRSSANDCASDDNAASATADSAMLPAKPVNKIVEGKKKKQKRKKKISDACGKNNFQNHSGEQDSEIGAGHENGVGNRLTLAIPDAQLAAAEKKTSRERRDFNFLANIRTAIMLFVVTVVFTFCFVPAWLMACNLLTYQPIVFYMHYLYNVANPVIYAFMNQSFRKELKRVFQRGTHLLRSG